MKKSDYLWAYGYVSKADPGSFSTSQSETTGPIQTPLQDEGVQKCLWIITLLALYGKFTIHAWKERSRFPLFHLLLRNVVFHKCCISTKLCKCLNNGIVWVLQSFWYKSDLWIKLVLHSSFQKRLLWPFLLHFPNGFFTTMTKLNDYLSHL